MKTYQIDVGKICRAEINSVNGSKVFAIILIVDCEDRHINIGGHDRCIQEWVYYMPTENGTFGTFTELDTKVVESLSEVKSEPAIRNLCNSLKDKSQADKDRIQKWLRNKDVAISMAEEKVSVCV